MGVDDLLVVKGRFLREIGAPERVYVIGASMGGATAQLMAQEFPDEIDGALAFCGALSNIAVADFLGSWHALALWLLRDLPPRPDAAGLVAWARPLGEVDGAGRLRLTAIGEQFAALIRALTGGEGWGFAEGLGLAWERNWARGALFWPEILAGGAVTARAGAVIAHDAALGAFDTTAVTYRSDPPGLVDTERINAEVMRFAASPAARRDPAIGVAGGPLGVPLLTLKNTGDLLTPLSLEAALLARAEAAGDAANLVMRFVRRAGHCAFESSEGLAAIAALRDWVENGERPAGEDPRGDRSRLGVAFTERFDPDDPLRP